eukprot:1291925-Rhodomonas_salina.1
MYLVEEGEHPVLGPAVLAERKGLRRASSHHDLAVAIVEEHTRVESLQPPSSSSFSALTSVFVGMQRTLQEVPRHLFVGKAGDQRAGVDERVVLGLAAPRRDRVKDRERRPPLLRRPSRSLATAFTGATQQRLVDNEGVGEGAKDPALALLVELTAPKPTRQQVGRRAREPQPPPEDDAPAELLRRRGDFARMLLHCFGERFRQKELGNGWTAVLQQLEDSLHVRRVVWRHQLQVRRLPVETLPLVEQHCFARRLRAQLQAGSDGMDDNAVELLVGGALGHVPNLDLEVILQPVKERLDVFAPKAPVLVRQDCHRDLHIGLSKIEGVS